MSGAAKTITISNLSGNVNIGDAPEYQINSAINELLILLATKGAKFVRVDQRPTAEVVAKIKHNNIAARSHIIRQYLEYSSKIEDAYKEVDALVPFGKDTILRSLNGFYFKALDEVGVDYLCEQIDILKIRDNSVFILASIINKLSNFVYESMNKPAFKENVDVGVNVVVAHAFIECVIMENPNSAP